MLPASPRTHTAKTEGRKGHSLPFPPPSCCGRAHTLARGARALTWMSWHLCSKPRWWRGSDVGERKERRRSTSVFSLLPWLSAASMVVVVEKEVMAWLSLRPLEEPREKVCTHANAYVGKAAAQSVRPLVGRWVARTYTKLGENEGGDERET